MFIAHLVLVDKALIQRTPLFALLTSQQESLFLARTSAHKFKTVQTAMAVLQSKLLERRRQEEQAKINALKGDNSGSWGNQMRSYVLAPYQMVKDLRTDHETGNTGAVLDGEIDDFIEAGIRWRRSS